MVQTPGAKWGDRRQARRAPRLHCGQARQPSSTHRVRTRWAPRAHQSYVVQMKAELEFYLYLFNISLCLLQKQWKWLVLLFKGGRRKDRWLKGGAPMETLTVPKGHHGMAMGVPRTHRWDLSTHTWDPRHVWCAPRGRNSMGSGVAYLLSAQARGRLSLVWWANWGSHGRNALCIKKDQSWAQCHDSLLWSWTWHWKQATRPSHGHLDMAWAHTSMWGRHIDAPDT